MKRPPLKALCNDDETVPVIICKTLKTGDPIAWDGPQPMATRWECRNAEADFAWSMLSLSGKLYVKWSYWLEGRRNHEYHTD